MRRFTIEVLKLAGSLMFCAVLIYAIESSIRSQPHRVLIPYSWFVN